MSARNWAAGVAAAVTMTAGITVVQSGITGTQWPDPWPRAVADTPSTAGLPAPGEVGAGTLPPAGPMLDAPAAAVTTQAVRSAPPEATGDRHGKTHRPAGKAKHQKAPKQGKGDRY